MKRNTEIEDSDREVTQQLNELIENSISEEDEMLDTDKLINVTEMWVQIHATQAQEEEEDSQHQSSNKEKVQLIQCYN